MEEIKRLLTEDAPFHVVRKIPDVELSVLHSACSLRQGAPKSIFPDLVKYLIQMNAPINDRDAYGQTALHYAVCHHDALPLVTLMVENGAQLDSDRQGDGWTPLHLAAMFNKLEVVLKLLEMGADPKIKATNGDMPEDVAKTFKNHRLADVLSSPRQAHAPKSFASVPVSLQKYDTTFKAFKAFQPPFKLTDEQINWKDEVGNTILHYAAWTGNIYLARHIFENAQSLIEVANDKGATPIALAIIATQVKMVEEFFMNKISKNCIDLTTTLKDSKDTIAHLLLQYAPYVDPKFLLKRKDLTMELLNSVNAEGNTPLLHVASRNNMHTVRHILTNKAVKDGGMLDLSIRNRQGKTVLHYLVEHKDEENFRILLDRAELTVEVANIPDKEGKTPMTYCLTKGSAYMARDIFMHPTGKEKFRLDQYGQYGDGRSALHLVAELGNVTLWNLAVERPDCDLKAKDSDGNTPLMKAVICKRLKILEAWLLNKELSQTTDQNFRIPREKNNAGKTLVMLFVEHLTQPQYLKILLNTKIDDTLMKSFINSTDNAGNTALLIACQMSKWSFAKELISNSGLKIGEIEDEMEGTIDLHPIDTDGSTALTLQVLARIKLIKAEQTYNMKKQRVQAVEAKKEYDEVWELIKLMLVREKEQQGHSKADCVHGSECIKEQFKEFKLIRPQTTDEIVQEYIKLYQVMKKKKPAVQPAAPINDRPFGDLTPPGLSGLSSVKSAPAPTPVPTPGASVADTLLKDAPDSPKRRRNNAQKEIMEKMKRLQEGGDLDQSDMDDIMDNIVNTTDTIKLIKTLENPISTPVAPSNQKEETIFDIKTEIFDAVAEASKNTPANDSAAPLPTSLTPVPSSNTPVTSMSTTTSTPDLVVPPVVPKPVSSTPVTGEPSIPSSVTPMKSVATESKSETPVTVKSASPPRFKTYVPPKKSEVTDAKSETPPPVTVKLASPPKFKTYVPPKKSEVTEPKSETPPPAPVKSASPPRFKTYVPPKKSENTEPKSETPPLAAVRSASPPRFKTYVPPKKPEVTEPKSETSTSGASATESVSLIDKYKTPMKTPEISAPVTQETVTPAQAPEISTPVSSTPVTPKQPDDSTIPSENVPDTKKDSKPESPNEQEKPKENGAKFKFIPGKIERADESENKSDSPPLAPARHKSENKSTSPPEAPARKKSENKSTSPPLAPARKKSVEVSTQTDDLSGLGCSCCCTCKK